MTFHERFPNPANNPQLLDAALDTMVEIAGKKCSADIFEFISGAVWGIRFMRTYMAKCAYEAQADAAAQLWADYELGE